MSHVYARRRLGIWFSEMRAARLLVIFRFRARMRAHSVRSHDAAGFFRIYIAPRLFWRWPACDGRVIYGSLVYIMRGNWRAAG